MSAYTEALNFFDPEAKFDFSAGENFSAISWEIQTPPTEQAFAAKVSEIVARDALVICQENRSREYPSIADQLDALYHGGYDGWKAVVQQVKDKYPKPE